MPRGIPKKIFCRKCLHFYLGYCTIFAIQKDIKVSMLSCKGFKRRRKKRKVQEDEHNKHIA